MATTSSAQIWHYENVQPFYFEDIEILGSDIFPTGVGECCPFDADFFEEHSPSIWGLESPSCHSIKELNKFGCEKVPSPVENQNENEVHGAYDAASTISNSSEAKHSLQYSEEKKIQSVLFQNQSKTSSTCTSLEHRPKCNYLCIPFDSYIKASLQPSNKSEYKYAVMHRKRQTELHQRQKILSSSSVNWQAPSPFTNTSKYMHECAHSLHTAETNTESCFYSTLSRSIARFQEMTPYSCLERTTSSSSSDVSTISPHTSDSFTRHFSAANDECSANYSTITLQERTPMWRDGPKTNRLCNACGIRWQKYGVICAKCSYIPRKAEKCQGICPHCQIPLPLAAPTRRRLSSKPKEN
eukprot:gene6440-9333_t